MTTGEKDRLRTGERELTVSSPTADAFDPIIGQVRVKHALRNAVKGAISRGSPLPHSLFHGPAGTGKTTMARAVAQAIGHRFIELHGTTIKTIADLRAGITAASGGIRLRGDIEPPSVMEMLIDADEGRFNVGVSDAPKITKPQIVFVDEIHRLPRVVQENLYAIMDDGQVHLKIVADSLVPLDLPPTCVVGATTDAGLLTQSLRDRFKLNVRMEEYSIDDVVKIGQGYMKKEWERYKIKEPSLIRLTFPARFNPRLLSNLIDCCVDTASAQEKRMIDDEVVDESFYVQGIEKNGLHKSDKLYLTSLLNGAVSLEVLSMHTQTDALTLRNVVEPFLSRIGAIKRSSRGRELTADGVKYLSKEYGLQVGS